MHPVTEKFGSKSLGIPQGFCRFAMLGCLFWKCILSLTQSTASEEFKHVDQYYQKLSISSLRMAYHCAYLLWISLCIRGHRPSDSALLCMLEVGAEYNQTTI